MRALHLRTIGEMNYSFCGKFMGDKIKIKYIDDLRIEKVIEVKRAPID